MPATHKTVAYRIDSVRDGVRVTALTQSPRGTRIMSGSVQVSSEGLSKEEFIKELEGAFTKLQVTAAR